MNQNRRTDLAMEARELWRESADKTTLLPGVEAIEETDGSFKITTVKVLNEQGESELCKPIGDYVTIELDGLIHREENAFTDAAALLSSRLCGLLKLGPNESVLVTGLGNSSITPDAIGPEAIGNVMVTKHLKEQLPEHFGAFRSVTAISAGVLGTTGIESAELLTAIIEKVRPDRVIAIDALASNKMERLCRTVQITDTGIVPGSGVGNSRSAINEHTVGVPVVAVGVPTVVDALSLAADIAERAGVDLSDASIEKSMIVTPRDIDKSVKDIAKLIGYGINLALHDGLTVQDIDMFVS